MKKYNLRNVKKKMVLLLVFCAMVLSNFNLRVFAGGSVDDEDLVEVEINSSDSEEEDENNVFDCIYRVAVDDYTKTAKIYAVVKTSKSHGRLCIPSEIFYLQTKYDVAEIDTGAFACCDGLTSVVIPGSVKTIGYKAFLGCNDLKKVILQEGVINIFEFAFANCGALKNITIPNSMERIEQGAFMGSEVSRVELPTQTDDGLIKEWHNVCDGKPLVTKNYIDVEVEGDRGFISEIYTKEIDGIKYRLQEGSAIVVGYNKDLSGDIEIPAQVEFNSVKYNVVEISNYSFFCCLNITGIKLNHNIRNIGVGAFMYCENLKSVELPDMLLKIEEQSFSNCSSLEKIVIPGTVEFIGNGTFLGCKNLVSAELQEGTKYIGVMTFLNCEKLETLKLPNSLEIIHKKAFRGCDKLKKINLPEDKILCNRYGVFVANNITKGEDDLYFF